MTLIGGKRKVNKSLKAWVAFVKKVQKEEKLSYKDAIHRAKQRKDKGEKWMIGGNNEMEIEDSEPTENPDSRPESPHDDYIDPETGLSWGMGGRRKSHKRSHKKRGKTIRRKRTRSSRRR